MNDTVPILEHPSWCNPMYCSASDVNLRGRHMSTPVQLDVGFQVFFQPAIVRASLSQAAPGWPTDVYLLLEAGGGQVSLPVATAVRMRHALGSLLALAEDGGRV
jgi:hypothetical protein